MTDWDRLYADLSPVLYRRALGRLRSPELAEEVVQTTWLMVAGKVRHGHDGDLRSLVFALFPRAIRAVGSKERDQRRAVVLLEEGVRPVRTDDDLAAAIHRPRCQVCGQWCARPGAKYCSRRCYGLAIRRTWRRCARPGCHRPVSVRRARAKYCSRLCEGIMRGVRYPLPLPRWLTPRTCPVCGRTWWPEHHQAAKRRCCSESCARRLGWMTAWARRGGRGIADLSRAGAPPAVPA